MSTLNQFFPSAGGDSSSGSAASNAIRTRVQVTEGGHGASCYTHSVIYCTNTNQCCCAPYLTSGRGGGVADFNLNIQPGTTCTITVGYGGTSYNEPFDAGPTQCFIPNSEYPTIPAPTNCGPYWCGKMGSLGGPSKFGALGFYPMGTSEAKFPRYCPASATYCMCATVNNFPAVDLNYLCPTDDVREQNLPANSVGNFTDYAEFNKGFRGFSQPSSYSCTCKIIQGSQCDCAPMFCSACGCFAPGNICLGGASSGGGADNCKQIDRWGGEIYTNIPAPLSPCSGKRIPIKVDCGGYTSYITGAACSYGVGGFIVQNLYAPQSPYTSSMVDAPCGKAYCCNEHSQYRFPGSGGGASSVYCCTFMCCIVPGSVECNGCPGSVIVQYPTCYGAAVSTGSSIIDCSPNTPGMRTYKFMCPGTIQFP
tara:strand:- start:1045 stop:2310 length:1266 start_codon:yes stop_codon:yes gene_type:complete